MLYGVVTFVTILNHVKYLLVYLPGGRRTPHARTRYDTTLQTPGAADDKPLVTAQVHAIYYWDCFMVH